MTKLKVSVLFWEFPEENVVKHDKVADDVSRALTEIGHETALLAVTNDLRILLDGIEKQKPDLVFNLCETFADSDAYEPNVVGVLEMIGQKFTGTGSVGMALRRDKAIAKKLLVFHEVQTPQFAVFDTENLEFAGKMRFPLFVKPLHGDSSSGVDQLSLVNDYDGFLKKINAIRNELRDAALVEEYIAGREFYVTIVGNDPREALPLIELDFSKLPDSFPPIYDQKAKSDKNSTQYQSTHEIVAVDLPAEVRNRVVSAGIHATQILQVADYGRVDIRLALDGTPYVVEVNANPYLEQSDTVALSALQAGLEYPRLIGRIVDSAMSRYAQPRPQRQRSRSAATRSAKAKRG